MDTMALAVCIGDLCGLGYTSWLLVQNEGMEKAEERYYVLRDCIGATAYNRRCGLVQCT